MVPSAELYTADAGGAWVAPGRPGDPNPPPPPPPDPGGTDLHEVSDFTAAESSAFFFLNGVTGQGVDTTIYRMRANTSTKGAQINALVKPQTNPYRLVKVGSGSSGSQPAVTVKDLTIQGTPQGHMYGGLDVRYSTNAQISNVKITGIPGNAPGPPGETFGMHAWRANNPTFSDIIIDGRDATGTAVAATLNGIDYLPAGATFNRIQHSYAQYGFGMAVFQVFGTQPYTWNNCSWTHCRATLNLEDIQTNAPLIFNNCTFGPTFGTGRGEIAQISSKGYSAHVRLIDPIPVLGLTYPIKMRWYPNQTGGTQVKSDIQCFMNGVEVTNDPTKFLLVNY